MTDLTPAAKKKLMIADNKIFNLGVENLTVLNEFIEELRDDLDIPGFDEDILRDMVADAEEVTETIASYGLLDEEEVQEVRQASAEREARREASPEPTERAVSAQDSSDDLQTTATAEGAENGRFITCPKCGEKIWL